MLTCTVLCMQMIGIWCLTVWQQLGSPSKMRLVELGPGRGTLMADLLRGTAPFKPFISGLDVHLVEVSHMHSCLGCYHMQLVRVLLMYPRLQMQPILQ